MSKITYTQKRRSTSAFLFIIINFINRYIPAKLARIPVLEEVLIGLMINTGI